MFKYVKSFIAASPEELEEAINAFIADPAFIPIDIDFITPIHGDSTACFGAFLTYRTVEEANGKR